MEMGKSLGYVFDEVHVKRGIYAPEAHAQFETEEQLIRVGLLRLLHGQNRLKMGVTSLPVSEEALKEQKALREGLQELVDGKRRLEVSVSNTAKNKKA